MNLELFSFAMIYRKFSVISFNPRAKEQIKTPVMKSDYTFVAPDEKFVLPTYPFYLVL